MRVYFYASIDVDEEDFGDWELDGGQDLSEFVADELTRSSTTPTIYVAERKDFFF